MPISQAKIKETAKWLAYFREDWELETPIRIHGYGVDDGHGLGGPPLHPEFVHWLGPVCFCGRKPDPKDPNDKGCPSLDLPKLDKKFQKTESRTRTTRAFRKLRRVAPREFDALYLMCAHKTSFQTALQSLNERAERLGKPERYGPAELMLLVVSGVDKVVQYW